MYSRHQPQQSSCDEENNSTDNPVDLITSTSLSPPPRMITPPPSCDSLVVCECSGLMEIREGRCNHQSHNLIVSKCVHKSPSRLVPVGTTARTEFLSATVRPGNDTPPPWIKWRYFCVSVGRHPHQCRARWKKSRRSDRPYGDGCGLSRPTRRAVDTLSGKPGTKLV